ncbi:ATP-binding protein [Spirillospora sp. CA-294931]|uniref:ATP-binding protein n=1 Tax=Spirillospora sp. CA-294931 TaxID=3240042 RepID=UPI003D8AEC66
MGIETMVHDELDMTCLAARTAPAQVRTLLGFRLAEWGLDRIAHDVCLIASELIANAVDVTPEGQIRIRFTREPGAVMLSVWDSSDLRPIARPVEEWSLDDITPDPEALDEGHDDQTGGWGLPIVQALSSECGLQPTQPGGKWVWASLAC